MVSRKQLEIGPSQTGLDEEVASLVWAMNKLPGIETTNSCSGHGKTPFHIWFHVTDFNARGFLTLSRLLSHNYHPFWIAFRVTLCHADTDPQVCFLLESRHSDFEFVCKAAADMATCINQHVNDEVYYYNILFDRVGNGPRVKDVYAADYKAAYTQLKRTFKSVRAA